MNKGQLYLAGQIWHISSTSKVSSDGHFLCMRNIIKEVTHASSLTQQHFGTEGLVLENATSPWENYVPTLASYYLLMFWFLWTWKWTSAHCQFVVLEPHHWLVCNHFTGLNTDTHDLLEGTGCLPKRRPRRDNGRRSIGKLESHTYSVTIYPIVPENKELSSVYTSSKSSCMDGKYMTTFIHTNTLMIYPGLWANHGVQAEMLAVSVGPGLWVRTHRKKCSQVGIGILSCTSLTSSFGSSYQTLPSMAAVAMTLPSRSVSPLIPWGFLLLVSYSSPELPSYQNDPI